MITTALKALAKTLNKNILNPFVNANTFHKALYVGNGDFIYKRNMNRWVNSTPQGYGYLVHPYYYV